MGAMAPSPHWVPEDDLLLKNAVEAGASLESLAKGAVQFSRRYTVEELQDRWFSLLYDPVVSVDASDHMIEVERSTFTNQSRPNKLEGVKEIPCSSGKRKAASIRKCYYAMRKRISNDPFDLMDINPLSGPGNSNFGDGNELSSADCGIGNPVSNDLEIEEPEFDMKDHYFSEFGPHAAESIGNDVAPSFSTAQNNGQGLHLGGKNASHSLSYPYEENISLPGDHSEVRGFDQSKELPLCNLFEAEGLENEGNAFRSFGYSSPLPQMPIWSTSPDISSAGLPIQIREKDQVTGNTFIIPEAGYANEPEALRYGGDPSNSKLKMPLSCDSMIDETPQAENYFEELSNALFTFTTEEELLFMDSDGKNTIDKSYYDGLSSLLLDSPNQTELPSVGLGETEVLADGHFNGTSVPHLGGSDGRGPYLCYDHKVPDDTLVPDAQVASSVSTMKGFGPEYRNGVICCTLNTEDPDIPSNDDVFLPFRFPSPTNSSGAHWRLGDPSYLVSSSVKELSSARKTNGRPPMMKNNQKVSSVPSRMIISSQPSDMGLSYPIGDHGVKFELPKSSIQHAALRNARNTESPNLISSANVSANNFIAGVFKGGAMEMEKAKNLNYKSVGSCIDKHDHRDILQNLQKNASGSRNGLDIRAETFDNGSSDADPTRQMTIVPQPNEMSLVSDEGEETENEFDVPYYSDVEAMILGMDLGPDESDLFANPEVRQYQHEETKRTIIRLEQAADACTQRAMAAQGAFAVLYDRHSKHFIKKPEVLIGRATEDTKVDIDLGREKNGGKISRRQAILKMDMYGIFHLKNLGKCAVYVNGKEVASGQSVNLTSGCLVQIRELSFAFEMSHTRIKQYVDSVVDGSILLDHKPPN